MNPLTNLNPPTWVRALLYLLAAVAELTRQLLVDEHTIDQAVARYISGLIALVLLLAVGNATAQAATAVTTPRRRARKAPRG